MFDARAFLSQKHLRARRPPPCTASQRASRERLKASGKIKLKKQQQQNRREMMLFPAARERRVSVVYETQMEELIIGFLMRERIAAKKRQKNRGTIWTLCMGGGGYAAR